MASMKAPVQLLPAESLTSGPPPLSTRNIGLTATWWIACLAAVWLATAGIQSQRWLAILRSSLSPSSSMVIIEPTISRWLSSSVAMSMNRSYIFGFFSRSTNAWVKYCSAAVSSPLAPPNCSMSNEAKRGSGSVTRTSNCRSLL